MSKPGPLTGQTLGGKYLLGDLLGKGGFGAVYQAQYVLLNRSQAIKLLLEEHFSDPKFRERFLREARTLAALDHPNIVHVDELGMQGNLFYLVMPYLSGGTLQEVLAMQRGPLPPEHVDSYLAQICAALDYAHAQGVVHLDLKPLNLLRHQDGRLLLSDFGLAHLMKEGAVQGGTSLSFGTPLYMAPEHLRGQPDWRSDLYALGVMLYQMLTGRLPFEGSTPEAIMLKHVMDPPPALRAIRPDLPIALESVLTKSLAKQPDQRYQRAGELLADFRAALGRQASQSVVDMYSAPTRISQPMQGKTVRAAHPPASSLGQAPMFPSPSTVSVPKTKTRAWTKGFTGLFVAAVVASGVASYFVLLAEQFNLAGNLIVPYLLLGGGLGGLCVVALRLIRSRLLIAGFLLLCVSAFLSLILIFLSSITPFSLLVNDTFNGYRVYDLNLPFLFSLLTLTGLTASSLTCFSYGIAPWKPPSFLRIMIPVIACLGAIGVMICLVVFVATIDHAANWTLVPVAIDFCMATVFLLLLFKSAWWRHHVGVIANFLLGTAILFVAYFYIGLNRPYGLDMPYAVSLVKFLGFPLYGAYALFSLGLLILVQTERAQKRVQKLL